MTAVLYCPDDNSCVPFLARRRPLVLAPFLGKTVLEHAMVEIGSMGVKRVRVEAPDRIEEINAVLGQGQAWGIEVEVLPVASPQWETDSDRVFILDRLPQLMGQPLWQSYRGWYAALQALMETIARQRVGMREVAPGAFVGLGSQVAASARLIGPCWIGAHVWIGSGAVIGPGSIIEDGCYVDSGAEMTGSVLGPRTYLGSYTELRDSFAWGNELLNFDSGSHVQVTDQFILGEVRSRSTSFSPLRRLFSGRGLFYSKRRVAVDAGTLLKNLTAY